MPVDTKHPDYSKALERWKRNRDVLAGEDEVKSAGEKYLPRIGAQTDEEYKAYLKRASFFNATGRTHDGLTGMQFRKTPAAELPGQIKDWQLDIDLAGTPLEKFVQRVASDDIAVGRGGILAEYPRAELRERTDDETRAEGLRPYLVYYPAEAILDWREGRINNRTTLVFLKLAHRSEEPKPDDPWVMQAVDRIRVYRLAAEGATVETYLKGKDGWVLEEPPVALFMAGKPADEIPFVFTSGVQVEKSPLDDLVSMNLSHYRTVADYENSAHWASTPTPVFIGDIVPTGVDGDGQPVTEVRLGSSSGINIGVGGDVKMLQAEMEEGLGAVLDRKETYMAILGARILAPDKRQVEAAETAAIHRAGENSVLATRANAVSQAVKKALEFMARFANISGTVGYSINTDYFPQPMSAQELTAIVSSWISGALTDTELFDALKAGEVIKHDKDYEEHAAEAEEAQRKKDESADAALAATVKAMAKGGRAE
jgi:hypothetical protein